MQSVATPLARVGLRPGGPVLRRGPLVVLGLIGAAIPLAILVPATGSTLGPLGYAVGLITAGWTYRRGAARMNPADARAWALAGSGLLVLGTGVVAVGVVDVAAGGAPAFGPLDVFFIAGYLLLFRAASLLPRLAVSRIQRQRILIDGLIGAVALLAILWITLLGDVVHLALEASLWEGIVASLYPALDAVALVVLVMLLTRRSSAGFDVRIGLLVLALASQFIADAQLSITGAGQNLHDALPNYPLFLTTVAAIVASAVLIDHRPPVRDVADRPAPWWSVLAPYGALALLGLFLVLGSLSLRIGQDVTVLLGAVVMAGFLLAVRQALAIREIRTALDRQRMALVASLSHELRTPLTSLVGFLDLIEADELGEAERGEAFAIVQSQAGHLSRLIEDLATLDRTAPGELKLDLEHFPVRGVLRDAAGAADLVSGRVDVDCPGGLVVVADRFRLRQVIVALLTNAARYGGPQILLNARAVNADLVIEVHDNGSGVPRRWEYAVWERFERGEHRLDASIPGLGLGLSIVRAVAEAHGGAATYRRSESLGGACFSVVLPGRVLGA